MKRFVGICIACALISGCAAPTDNRGAPQPFPGYDGQTINVIINYAARGNTDLQAQAILRHLKRHIPGSPKFEFEYSSGNGGLVGANFLGNEGRRNGLTMGIFTIPVMAQIMRAPELRVDLRNFEIAGSIAEQTVSHIRVDAIPGKNIRSYKDILYTKHAIRTGGHGPNSSKDLRARLVLEVLKIPQKHVTRYRSGGRIRAAIRKDELYMSADSLLGYYGRVASQLIDTGISVPLWHMGHLTLDGNLKCSHTVPKEIPCFIEVYEEKFGKGKRPAKLYWDAIRTIAGSREMLRFIVFPKGTSKKAVNIMRAAWAKTMKDPAYLEEYRRMNRSSFVGMAGMDAQKYLKKLLTISPELQRFLLAYAAAAEN